MSVSAPTNGQGPGPAAREGRTLPAETDVAIVGAGFGGLAVAHQLRQAGRTDFVICERAGQLGGTWRDNTYPGCQCDIPSNLYSFSFAPKPDWTRSYPLQPEILEYMHTVADQRGLTPHIRLDHELLDARWREDAARWEIETSQGTMRARVLVAAPGLLSEPVVPELEGLESFGGAVFHSADWDHEHELAGRRVAVIGTGASAIQIVPEIQPLVSKLALFQRTPPWIVPHPDRPVQPWLRRAYATVPGLQRLARGLVYVLHEAYVIGMVYRPPLLRAVEAAARAMLRLQVRDPGLRRRLTPDYRWGCKRPLLSNRWYPAITQPNVEVIAEPAERLTPSGVVAADGTEYEVDTVIFATGFSPSEPPIARRLHGTAGRTLSEQWAGSPRAHRGIAVTGFPNLFLCYGPNTNLAHSSIIYMLESQARYIRAALEHMDALGLDAVEPRSSEQQRWCGRVEQELEQTVWNRGGCSSWYLDRNGRNSIMWPGFTFDYRREVATFDPQHYRGYPRQPSVSLAAA